MKTKPYQTIDDLSSIVVHHIPESTVLEYKSSSILNNKDALCKTVTALANSMGGNFLIGIESKNGKPIRLDGGVPGPSKLDWLYKIFNANTFPSVECLQIAEIPNVLGTYYVIEVVQSPQAPHQSADRRYYKRRGTHSEPMEHYEIEDVRNRPKEPLSPLRIGLHIDGFIAVLVIANTHPVDTINNIQCNVRDTFGLPQNRLSSLQNRGIRKLHPQSERRFVLDAVHTILNNDKEGRIELDLTYEFHEIKAKVSEVFYFADFNETMVVQSPTEKAIEKLGERIDKLISQLDKIHQEIQTLSRIADGSGLRLSQRTLRALQKKEQLSDPSEFDWQGYKIILNISHKEAMALHTIFGYSGSRDDRRHRYAELPEELRTKFEACFKVDFD
jgi:hypothetical protein